MYSIVARGRVILSLRSLNALIEPFEKQLNPITRPAQTPRVIISMRFDVNCSQRLILDVVLEERRGCGLFAMGNAFGRQGRPSRVTDQDRAILVRTIDQIISQRVFGFCHLLRTRVDLEATYIVCNEFSHNELLRLTGL